MSEVNVLEYLENHEDKQLHTIAEYVQHLQDNATIEVARRKTLESLLLLTHSDVMDHNTGDLQVKQWNAYVKQYPDADRHNPTESK